MTQEDIKNIVRIYFSHYKIKLFKNEPHKKMIDGNWQSIFNLGYPPGSPDLMGWRITDGKVCGVEIKTINDRVSKKQTEFFNLMKQDNCLIFLAIEIADKKIKLIDWVTKEEVIING